MPDGQPDHVGFDIFKRAQVAVGGVEHHPHALLVRGLRRGSAAAEHVG